MRVSLVPGHAQEMAQKLDGSSRHMTVLSPQEYKIVTTSNHDADFDGSAARLYFLGVWKRASCWYHVVGAPQFQLQRLTRGLPWAHFHITLGFDQVDEHEVDKGPSTLIHFDTLGIERAQERLDCLKDY